jgi:hypothetical protein
MNEREAAAFRFPGPVDENYSATEKFKSRNSEESVPQFDARNGSAGQWQRAVPERYSAQNGPSTKNQSAKNKKAPANRGFFDLYCRG